MQGTIFKGRRAIISEAYLTTKLTSSQVSLHVLVNTLAGIPPSSSSYPRVLLVQFLDNRPVTRGSLFHSLQQRLPGHPSEKIDAMISKVQIYRAFEFNEILETVTRISDTLHNIQQQQKQAATRAEGSDHRASRVSSDEEIEPTLVILEGIDRSLEEVVRSSNPLAGQAKLTTLLRTLTILSRTYAPFVTIIVVNTISLPAVLNGPEPQGRGYEAQSAQTLARISPADTSAQNNVDAEQRRYRTQPNQRYHQQQTHPSIPIQPIFAQAPASLPLSVPRPIAPYPSLLARTLDQGFDTHLLISRVQGRIVIEVAKDRVGDHLGRWCAL